MHGQSSPRTLTHQLDDTSERYQEEAVSKGHIVPGSTRSFGNLPFSSAVTANHFPIGEQELQLRNFRLPVWKNLPRWESDESPVGRTYTDFIRLYKTDAVDGHSHYVNNSSLVEATYLFRKLLSTEPYTADSWACDFQAAFSDPITQTIRIAGVYLLGRLMRWILDPSPTTYSEIPPMMRPTLQQRMRIHLASIDLMVIPQLRNTLISDIDGHTTGFIDGAFQAGFDVSWPYSVNEALVCTGKEGSGLPNRVFVSPAFAAHVSEAKNWVFGRHILDKFPDLVDSEITISSDAFMRPRDTWL